MSLSIIVASSGRDTLAQTLQSITPQLHAEDEVLVCIDRTAPWGHKSRNRMMPWAKGDWLLFMDDDDAYLPGALDMVRDGVRYWLEPVHIFKMRYPHGLELWKDKELRCGNVSTQMLVVPNREPYGVWGDRYEGDFDFLQDLAKRYGVVWHQHVIALKDAFVDESS